MKIEQALVIAQHEQFTEIVTALLKEGWRVAAESFSLAGATSSGPLGGCPSFIAGCVLEREVEEPALSRDEQYRIDRNSDETYRQKDSVSVHGRPYADIRAEQARVKAELKTAGYVLDTSSEKWPSRGPQDGDYRWMGSWLLCTGPKGRYVSHFSKDPLTQLRECHAWALDTNKQEPALDRYYAIIGHTGVYGVCRDPHDVLPEEPNARFVEISEIEYNSYEFWSGSLKRDVEKREPIAL